MDQRDPKEIRETAACQDHLELRGRWDPKDLKESWASQDDPVVRGWRVQKEREETPPVCRDHRGLPDLQDDRESSAAPKEPCFPSLRDPTARWLFTPMDPLRTASVRRDQRERRETGDFLGFRLHQVLQGPEEDGR